MKKILLVGLLLVPLITQADTNLLTAPWHLVGNNGAAEAYQSLPANALNGHTSITLTYDLHGLCLLGGDASGFIFDQSGWKLASILGSTNNCFNGVQNTTLPLSAFGVNTGANLTGSFHTRFWHQGAWIVDIMSAVLDAGTTPPPPPPLPPPPPPTATSTPAHIVMVLEENTNYSDALAQMPYLNGLGTTYAKANNYYGNTHPSIGNYFELTAGNILTDDNNFASVLRIDSIARQLTKAGKTWKVYAESLPSVGYTGGDVYPYIKHHNPFVYFADVVNTAEKNKVVPFSQFATDLAANNLPNFAFVIPNQLNNAHDGTLATADSWLNTNINPVFSNSTFQTDGLLIVTFDESANDNTNGGGKILTVFAGQNVKNGYNSNTLYQHESLLKQVEKFLSLPFTGDAAGAPLMGEFFK